MFRRRTTFVVGAGASCELGLPSGDQLKGDIRDVLAITNEHAFRFTDEVLTDGLRQMFPTLHTDDQAKIQKLAEAADRIRRGLPMAQSIDNYLHTHQSDDTVKQVGKAAIARVILRAERNSYLFGGNYQFYTDSHSRTAETPSLENAELQTTWYVPLAKLLFSLVEKDKPHAAFENLSFVIFNYDRCLEQFLWLALQAYFDLSGNDAASLLSSVEFIHPYGSLGPLPWQAAAGTPSVPLGGMKHLNCFKVGESLLTFTESVHSETGAQVANAIAEADMLILLGFGYLEQNLQLLSPPELEVTGAETVLGTAFGIQQPSFPIVRSVMKRLAADSASPDSLLIEPGKCIDLFRNYDMHLRF